MKAELYDNPTRFMVSSDSDPEAAYLVDLLANGRRGQCACQQWQYRVQPEIDKGAAFTPCKHWHAARSAFSDLMLRLAEKSSPPTDD